MIRVGIFCLAFLTGREMGFHFFNFSDDFINWPGLIKTCFKLIHYLSAVRLFIDQITGETGSMRHQMADSYIIRVILAFIQMQSMDQISRQVFRDLVLQI